MRGSLPNEGRVEICINNAWGSVCGNYWGNTDATVVCRQLEYKTQGWQQTYVFEGMRWIFDGYPPTDAVAFITSDFGLGVGLVILDDVGCRGSESRLIDCPKSFRVSCTNQRVRAGVRCQGS